MYLFLSRSKCFYCGFYSVASLTLKEAYLGAIEREIRFKGGIYTAENEYFVFRGRYSFLLGAWGTETNYSEIGGEIIRSSPMERTIELNPEDRCRKIARNKGFGV